MAISFTVPGKPAAKRRHRTCIRWKFSKVPLIESTRTILRRALDWIQSVEHSEDSCDLDHHGYCQTHDWPNEEPCPDSLAPDLIVDINSKIAELVGKVPYVQTYVDKAGLDEEKHISNCAEKAYNGRPLENPFIVDIVCFFEPAPSWPKWKREAALDGRLKHITKPDKDNCEKVVFDACNGIVWKDDSQIIDGHTSKQYGVQARTEVIVTVLEEYQRNPVTGG